jgi:hypothetical protein
VRLTEEEYAALTAKAPWRVPCKKPAKYRNSPTVVDGQRFDSRLEAKHYQHLKNLWELGTLAWFTRQVPFRLPGGITYRADFLVVWKDGRVSVQDVKGFGTRTSQIKIAQVEEIFGVTIEIIRKGKRS